MEQECNSCAKGGSSRVEQATEFDDLVRIRMRTLWRVVAGACTSVLMVGATITVLFEPSIVVTLAGGGVGGGTVGVAWYLSRMKLKTTNLAEREP